MEKSLDRFDITIIPEDSNSYQIKVLNPTIRNQMVQGHEGAPPVYWRDLHDKNLEFTSSHCPAKRLCAFHAKWATFRALNKGWIKEGEVGIPEYAWGSPDFDKRWILDNFFDEYGHQMGTWSPLHPKLLDEAFGKIVSILAYPLYQSILFFISIIL